MTNKHSQPFLEVVSRLYLPLDRTLDDLKQLHGIDFSEFLKRVDVVNINKPRKRRKGQLHRTSKKATGAVTPAAN